MEAAHPLEFETVRIEALTGDKLLVTLTGRWIGRQRPPAERATLIVQASGQRHEIPASSATRRAPLLKPRLWSGTFYVPSRLEPDLEGNTSLELGGASIPLPPGAFRGKPISAEGEPAESNQAEASGETQPREQQVTGGEQPATEATATGAPATEQPVAQQPVAQQPVADQPSEEPRARPGSE